MKSSLLVIFACAFSVTYTTTVLAEETETVEEAEVVEETEASEETEVRVVEADNEIAESVESENQEQNKKPVVTGNSTPEVANEGDPKIQTKFANQDSYVGDKISFEFDIPASKVKLVNGETIAAECIPAGLQMRVLTDPEDDGTVRAVILPGNEYRKCSETNLTKGSHPLASKLIEINPNYEGTTPRRTGWTYGTLVVPYKLIIGGSRSIKSSTTIGPYAGTSIRGWSGVEAEFILFAGPTLVENAFVDNGEAKTESLFGIGYGLGFIATLKQEFKLGLVFGADMVSDDSNYKDNKKPWGAIAIGYEFN